jgi:putative ABC transport system substrate-binding protein
MNPKLFWLITAILLVSLHRAEAQEPSSTRQTAKLYRIGVLTNVRATNPEASRLWSAFRQGLSERGWIEGRNIITEYRQAEGQLERFPSLAAELVRLKVDLIVAVSSLGVQAAKQATSQIPIVMIYAADPVGGNLVSSLARPGANVTGPTFIVSPEIVGKYLELLKEAVPKLSNVAVLFHEDTRPTFLSEAQAAATVLTIKLHPFEVRSSNDLESAFAAMVRERASGLLVLPSPFAFAHAAQIADLAAQKRLPAIYGFIQSVEAGGLMAYEASAPEMFWRAATYVDKILKGAKPADLPVEQPTKFELVINLKTAKQIDLIIPPNVLARADKVIR